MNESAQKICAKAFDTLDRVTAQRDAWEAERAAETDDQRFARENAEADAFLLELECRRLEREEPDNFSTVEKLKPEPKAQSMTDEDRAWVQQKFLSFADLIGEETGKNESKVAAVLREEIAVLRSEIEVLKKANELKGVVPMRGRNVA